MAEKNEKRRRIPLTFDEKRKIINLSDEGMSNSDIARRLGIPRTTIITVIKNKETVLTQMRSATSVYRNRDSLIADMERFLMAWIDEQNNYDIPLSQAVIKNKAQALYNDMKTMKGEAAKDSKFGASRGWFDRFKKRYNLHNIELQGLQQNEENPPQVKQEGINLYAEDTSVEVGQSPHAKDSSKLQSCSREPKQNHIVGENFLRNREKASRSGINSKSQHHNRTLNHSHVLDNFLDNSGNVSQNGVNSSCVYQNGLVNHSDVLLDLKRRKLQVLEEQLRVDRERLEVERDILQVLREIKDKQKHEILEV